MTEHTTPDPDSTAESAGETGDTAEAVLAGNPTHSNEDVRKTYREQAATMARLDPLNGLLTGRYRRRLFGTASGRVLDVACGVGTNERYLPEDCAYVGVDISPDMLAKARERLAGRRRAITLQKMDARDLDCPDDSFDTVISSLSTCTFPDPITALAEMGRVCRPDGRVLLLEHGRSSVGPIAQFQDWRADAHFRKHHCRWNQEPLEVIERSPLVAEDHSTAVLGVLTAIEARPE
jgi:ubiquinone/menaquinone biosynthesis C-methylase UbiE